jgi:bifunctional pyridoxal-dependent enzyme with beta-cystathionase and maltose regulon repressor activities
MWEKDSVINEANLASTSVDIAKMHAKYLQFLSMSKLKLKRTELDQKTLLKDKWLYYNGKMSGEEIDAKGWEYDPLNGLKVMKGDMDYYYDSDKDIQKSEEKVVYYKTLVDTLQEIVETLRWRHQTISNIIKWKMFESGN